MWWSCPSWRRSGTGSSHLCFWAKSGSSQGHSGTHREKAVDSVILEPEACIRMLHSTIMVEINGFCLMFFCGTRDWTQGLERMCHVWESSWETEASIYFTPAREPITDQRNYLFKVWLDERVIFLGLRTGVGNDSKSSLESSSQHKWWFRNVISLQLSEGHTGSSTGSECLFLAVHPGRESAFTPPTFHATPPPAFVPCFYNFGKRGLVHLVSFSFPRLVTYVSLSVLSVPPPHRRRCLNS